MDFEIALPPLKLHGPPDLYLDSSLPGGRVSLLFGEPGLEGSVLLTQFRAEQGVVLAGKTVGPGTRVERLAVAGAPALWIEGAPHAFVFVDAEGRPREDTRRLAGNALIWEREGVTLRLEGAIGRERALALALATEPRRY